MHADSSRRFFFKTSNQHTKRKPVFECKVQTDKMSIDTVPWRMLCRSSSKKQQLRFRKDKKAYEGSIYRRIHLPAASLIYTLNVHERILCNVWQKRTSSQTRSLWLCRAAAAITTIGVGTTFDYCELASNRILCIKLEPVDQICASISIPFVKMFTRTHARTRLHTHMDREWSGVMVLRIIGSRKKKRDAREEQGTY